jgi:hypothetical protein
MLTPTFFYACKPRVSMRASLVLFSCVVSKWLAFASASILQPPFGSGVHLFVDNASISESSGLAFEIAVPSKQLSNPVVYPEYLWETAVQFYTALVTVPAPYSITGNVSYILYYACANDTLFFNPVGVCVANSSDGIAWTKPLLPFYPFNTGSTIVDTNIVYYTPINEFLGNVFIDDGPTVPASERFKLAVEFQTDRQTYISVSADGYAWSTPPLPAITKPGFADTQVCLAPNPVANGYLAFGRLDSSIPNTTNGCTGGYASERHVMLSTTNQSTVFDNASWSTPVEVFPLGLPDPINCFDNYNPALLVYGDALFLFPSEFRHFALNDSHAPSSRAAGNDGIMDARILVSRTGNDFRFVSRDPIIPRGVGIRDPLSGLYNVSGSDRDAGFVFVTANGLLDTGDLNTISLLYWGSQTTHGMCIPLSLT